MVAHSGTVAQPLQDPTGKLLTKFDNRLRRGGQTLPPSVLDCGGQRLRCDFTSAYKNATFSYGPCHRTLERGFTGTVNRESPVGDRFPPLSGSKPPDLISATVTRHLHTR